MTDTDTVADASGGEATKVKRYHFCHNRNGFAAWCNLFYPVIGQL